MGLLILLKIFYIYLAYSFTFCFDFEDFEMWRYKLTEKYIIHFQILKF